MSFGAQLMRRRSFGYLKTMRGIALAGGVLPEALDEALVQRTDPNVDYSEGRAGGGSYSGDCLGETPTDDSLGDTAFDGARADGGSTREHPSLESHYGLHSVGVRGYCKRSGEKLDLPVNLRGHHGDVIDACRANAFG